MNPRRIETTLASFTLGALLIYFPLETWASLPYGLHDPFYLVDFIAMALLAWGSIHSLRARPRSSPAVLCAALGWASANGWRATFWRVHELQRGDALDHGLPEMWIVGVASAIALMCFIITLVLVVRSAGARK